MFLKRLVLLFPMLLLGGCTTLGYYLQAVNGEADVLRRARPIDRVLADPGIDASLKQKLGEVIEIRSFASKELGLPDNGTFRRYADLQRPYVVWNVFAAPEFSIDPKQWCYPLLGCANYRGYFSRDKAEAEAKALQQEGYDTYVAGIPAYSTLGWFDDPVLNTFIHFPEERLATLIFHELAHQVIYVSGDTTFNESFAVTVAREGTRRWLMHSGTEEQRAEFEASEQHVAAFTGLVDGYRARLAEVYAAPISDTEKRAQKADTLHALQDDYEKLKSTWGGFAGYDKWVHRHLNNAQLASVALYTQMVPAFQTLLAREGGDLLAFYRAVKDIAALPEGERKAVLQSLTELSGPAGHTRQRPG